MILIFRKLGKHWSICAYGSLAISPPSTGGTGTIGAAISHTATITFKFLAGLITGGGSYLDTVQSNIDIGDWRDGNASTALRVMVNDFGLIGCGIFLFTWGVISAFLVQKTREGSLYWAALLAYDIASVVWSPNQWYFVYGSRVLAPIVVLTYLAIMSDRRQRKSARHFHEPDHAMRNAATEGRAGYARPNFIATPPRGSRI